MAKVYQLVKDRRPDGKVRWLRSAKPVPGARWFIDYTDHQGKQVRRATRATSKAEAVGILRVKLGEIARAEAAGFSNPEMLSMTLEKFLDQIFMPHIRVTRRPSTSKNYEGYSLALKARFGGKLLPDLSREDILNFQSELLRPGREDGKKKRSPATVNRLVAFIRSVLYDALSRGYIGRNPAARIKLLPEDNMRTRVMSAGEERRLLEKSPPWLAPIIRVALLSGLRQGEVLRLRRQDVDRERRQLHVSAEAKDHEPRVIPYPELLEPVLEDLIPETGGEEGANPFLFSRKSGLAMSADRVRSAFKKAVGQAKIHDLHFHDLRRTYASRLIDLGASLPVIAELLGHSATYVTERYAHVSGKALESAVELLDQVSRFSADAEAATTASE